MAKIPQRQKSLNNTNATASKNRASEWPTYEVDILRRCYLAFLGRSYHRSGPIVTMMGQSHALPRGWPGQLPYAPPYLEPNAERGPIKPCNAIHWYDVVDAGLYMRVLSVSRTVRQINTYPRRSAQFVIVQGVDIPLKIGCEHWLSHILPGSFCFPRTHQLQPFSHWEYRAQGVSLTNILHSLQISKLGITLSVE